MDGIIQTKNEYRKGRWAELIRQKQESEMTVQGFCDAKGLKVKTYYYWLRKLREEACRQAVVAVPASLEVRAAESAGITLHAGDIRVEFGEGASPEAITAVICALQGRC